MPTYDEALKARLASDRLAFERAQANIDRIGPPVLMRGRHAPMLPPSRWTQLALWSQRAVFAVSVGALIYIWAIVAAAFLGIVLAGCGGRVEEEPNTTVVQEVVQWRAPPGWCCDRDMRDGSSSFECGRNTINWLPGDELISDQECWCNGTMKGPVCQ